MVARAALRSRGVFFGWLRILRVALRGGLVRHQLVATGKPYGSELLLGRYLSGHRDYQSAVYPEGFFGRSLSGGQRSPIY
jgi:hypothetical protein